MEVDDEDKAGEENIVMNSVENVDQDIQVVENPYYGDDEEKDRIGLITPRVSQFFNMNDVEVVTSTPVSYTHLTLPTILLV